LIEHWNGTQWSVDPNTLVPGGLGAVAAVTANDVWAVGTTDGTNYEPFAEHWDGTQWSLVNTPSQVDSLEGVTALASNNVWAVGSQGGNQTLAMQWNVASTPNKSSSGNNFFGVTNVPGTNKIWAVGKYDAPKSYEIHVLTESYC